MTADPGTARTAEGDGARPRPARQRPARRWPKRARRAGVAASVLVPAGVAAGIFAGLSSARSGHTSSAAGAVPVATATVVRTDLTNTTQVDGSLGYAGSYTISNQVTGTAYTALPGAGRTVRRGQELYEVDGTPVILFYGSRPEWRTLSEGVAAGPDVAQLDRNLIALGYATPAGLPVSDVFTAATATAVENWQAAAGLPVTGTMPLGEIAYAPGPLRVTSVTAGLGSTASPGSTVLAATSTTLVVQAAVPVSQEYLVKAGDQVTVTLPDGVTTTPGVVLSVSSVATAGSGSPSNGSPGSSSGGGSAGSSSGGGGGSSSGGGGGSSSGGGGGSQATVQMTVRLIHPAAAGNLDQAPVTVNIVSAQERGVLAVPVNALVALAGGGYAVQVVQGSARHLVAVQTGLFSSTLVQVSGAGLSQGMSVEVPAS
jgi:Putative peptidoglycan binding domain